MAWTPVGQGSGNDSNNYYYQDANDPNRWFTSSAQVPSGQLTGTAVPSGHTLATGAPPDTAPAALRSSYAAAHPPPEPTGGGTRRRPVTSGEVLHSGPSYPPDLSPAVSRLQSAGIDPDAYFLANPPPASGAARTQYIDGIRNAPAGGEGDAQLRDTFRIRGAEYELNALKQKGVPVDVAYSHLQAQGLLSPGAVPPTSGNWNDLGNPPRLGTPPGDRASALAALPHDTGSPPHRTTSPSDVTAALVDFGDRSHPASGSLMSRLSGTGTANADTVRTETRRVEITNQWMDYAIRPTTGTPPGLGYTPEQARGVMQNMSPPLLDGNGRVTAFDINSASHSLFNIGDGVTITNDRSFNAPTSGGAPPYTPRSPSLTNSNGTPWTLGQPVPSYTGEPNPLTRGAVAYARSPAGSAAVAGPPGAPPGAPVGSPPGNPASPPVPGSPAANVAPAGPALTGDALKFMRYQVDYYRSHGRPIPASLAGPARASGIDLSGLTLAGDTNSPAPGGGTGGATGGSGATGGVDAGTGGGNGAVVTTTGGSDPFAAVPPAPTGPPTPPATGTPLRGEWDRMIGMGFEPTEVAEYQRQHSTPFVSQARSDADINGSFKRPDGSDIPASEVPALRTRVRGEMRDGMINETANGLMATYASQNIQPPLTQANARLMAEQLYRERTSAGDGDASLSQMIGVRTNVAEFVHATGEPGHPERLNGTNPPGLLRRAAIHEENAFMADARAADPNGYWNGAAGQGHLRGFLSRDTGTGAAALNDPAAIREARTHGSPPLASRLAAYRAMPQDQRTAIEGAVTASNPPDTPDFSRIPAANRGQAEVQWQQTVIQHNWQETTTLRGHAWEVERHNVERAERVEDRDMQAADQYATARMGEDFQREQTRTQMMNQMVQNLQNQGFQMMQASVNQIHQLTLQQIQAMMAITQQLIAQGTPKPMDIVMGMLQGGRR